MPASMSKHTERGIGQHGGSPGDGRPEQEGSAPKASETRVTSPAAGPVGKHEGGRSELGHVTLLGVAAPIIERDKVTALGRDLHLPAEVRRAPQPRPAASDTTPMVQGARRSEPPDAAGKPLDPAATFRV